MSDDRREIVRDTPERRSVGVSSFSGSRVAELAWKGALAIAFAITTWRALEARVDDKLDTERWLRDSARRDARWVVNDSFAIRQQRDMSTVVCALLPQDTRCERR